MAPVASFTSSWGGPVKAGSGSSSPTARIGPAPVKSPVGFPLSSQFEEGRRGLYSDYQNSVAGANAKLQQLPYFNNVFLNRLNQDQGEADQRVNENFAGRGVFDSSFRRQQLGRTDNLFNRQRQDQGFQFADDVAGLQGQISGAGASYNRGLMDLLLQSGNAMVDDQSLPFYAQPKAQQPTKPVSNFGQFQAGGS